MTLKIKTNKDLGTYKDAKHTHMPMFIDGDLEYRKQAFYDFCEAWDKREDKWLKTQPHVFSHRLHWHQLPVFEELRKYRKEQGSLVDALHLCLLYCFTVENNTLFYKIKELPVGEFRSYILNYKEPLQRMDLFQLWLPSSKLDRSVPRVGILRYILGFKLRAIAQKFHDELLKQKSVMGMMDAKDLLVKIVQEESKWKRCSYACKNAVRHVAMAFNDLVDPESYVRPGTGSYQGFQQVFGNPFLMSKPDEAIQEQFKILADDPRANKLFYDDQKWLNIEDKICFFFKWLGFESGFRNPPRAPKNPKMVFPPEPFTFRHIRKQNMDEFNVQTNKHLFKLRKVADYGLGSDNIGRMRLLDDADLTIPNGLYLILENGIPVYTGVFSENDKYKKNFGTRHLYTRRDRREVDGKLSYLIYHHLDCHTGKKDINAPEHPRTITKSLREHNEVSIYVITRNDLMDVVGHDDCITLKSVEDRFIKQFNLTTKWNKFLDKTVGKYA